MARYRRIQNRSLKDKGVPVPVGDVLRSTVSASNLELAVIRPFAAVKAVRMMTEMKPLKGGKNKKSTYRWIIHVRDAIVGGTSARRTTVFVTELAFSVTQTCATARHAIIMRMLQNFHSSNSWKRRNPRERKLS